VTFSDLPRPRRRILLIDDDPDAALFTTHVLTTRGPFDVTHAADPAAALRAAAAAHWDLVLTEAQLPGVSCLELLLGLRRLAPALPVAVLTSHVATEAAVTELRGHAAAILHKPVRIDDLIAAVTALTSP
jgi:DNA-binding response OmpR family regulator